MPSGGGEHWIQVLPNTKQECQPLRSFPVASKSATNKAPKKGHIVTHLQWQLQCSVVNSQLCVCKQAGNWLVANRLVDFKFLHAKILVFEGVYMCLISQCIPLISCMPREQGNTGTLDLGCADEKVFWIAF